MIRGNAPSSVEGRRRLIGRCRDSSASGPSMRPTFSAAGLSWLHSATGNGSGL
ncbi:hypothetical protein FHS43_005391 [Streptosporangium becharense]|uniref:Uncharacterized protein n=1 Tax=Streptosporangium becharense TaxID=1816182 RepID=A0A7W9ME58_9ACTN|nr:hypothetical protein [Streptosporangium becharense]MBB5817106.1 hypothetical protein [Streptosporangium becharense]